MRSQTCAVTLIIGTLVAAALCSNAARAGGMPPPDLPDAQQLIQACWDKSTPLRESPDATQQRAGFDQTANCLEETIMAWLKPLMVGEILRTHAELRQQLVEIRAATRRLYTMIYGDHENCSPPCGSSDDTRPILRHIKILEEILTDTIRTAADHTGQLDDLPPPTHHIPAIPDEAFAALTDLPNPKSLIDRCWKISIKDRWGSNMQMGDGHEKTMLCLKQEILYLRRVLKFGGKTLTDEQTKTELEWLNVGIQHFYWSINNDSDYCSPACGSMWLILHIPPVSNAFSDMIRIMVAEAAGEKALSKLPAKKAAAVTPDVEDLIEECDYISEDGRAASDIRSQEDGQRKRQLCLKIMIEELPEKIGSANLMKDQEQWHARTSQLSRSLISLYWIAYTAADGCTVNCDPRFDVKTHRHTGRNLEVALRNLMNIEMGHGNEAQEIASSLIRQQSDQAAESRTQIRRSEAQLLIDSCLRRAGNHTRASDIITPMIRPDTVACLEKLILDLHNNPHFSLSKFESKSIKSELEKFRRSAEWLYTRILNEARSCYSGCKSGEAKQVSLQIAAILSDIFRTMYSETAKSMPNINGTNR